MRGSEVERAGPVNELCVHVTRGGSRLASLCSKWQSPVTEILVQVKACIDNRGIYISILGSLSHDQIVSGCH